MKRRQKENGGKTKNQTTENAMGQTEVALKTLVGRVDPFGDMVQVV